LNLRGQVIGVTAFHLLPGENLNFAIASDYIGPLLASKTVMPFYPETAAAAVENEETPQASREGEGEGGYETCGCAITKGVLVSRTSSSAEDVGRVPCGEKLTVFAKERGRLKVKSATGIEGYITSAFACKLNIPTDLPRDWVSLDMARAFTVRIDGDYLYESGYATPDGNYAKEIDERCETKRYGSEWTGKCRARVLLIWASEVAEKWCALELDEKITSVSPTRIEGESQGFVRGEAASDCPLPALGRVHFALIPKEFILR
jgi:hypothetical protein